MKRNFPRKQTKPNKLNYNTKGLKKKKKNTYLRDLCTANLRSANLNSQHVQKKNNKERINRNRYRSESVRWMIGLRKITNVGERPAKANTVKEETGEVRPNPLRW